MYFVYSDTHFTFISRTALDWELGVDLWIRGYNWDMDHEVQTQRGVFRLGWSL